MTVGEPDKPLRRYKVTYVQEVSHDMQAETITDAAAAAKRYAEKSGLRVLSVVLQLPMVPRPL